MGAAVNCRACRADPDFASGFPKCHDLAVMVTGSVKVNTCSATKKSHVPNRFETRFKGSFTA
jgi:hypothetical protein